MDISGPAMPHWAWLPCISCWGWCLRYSPACPELYSAGGWRPAPPFTPLWRWHQGKKQGYSLPGLLFAGLLAAVLCLVCIFRPQSILAFLPLVLGIALLIDGIGKLPLAVDAVRTLHTALTPVLWAAVLPLVLGIVLVADPFSAAKAVIRFFGIGLMLDGVCDLVTVLSARRH